MTAQRLFHQWTFLLALTAVMALAWGSVSAQAPRPLREDERLREKTHPIPSVIGLPAPRGVRAAPANDNFADREVLSATLPAISTTLNVEESTFEVDEPAPTCKNSELHSVWFSYTPPENQTLTIDLAGSGFDTMLTVYTGAALNALTEVACNDDYDFAVNGQSFINNFQAISGTEYIIRATELSGEDPVPLPADSSVSISVRLTPPPLNIAVTTTQDTQDILLEDGNCADINGNCSLRAAMMEANRALPGSSIAVPAGTYVLSQGGGGEDAAFEGDLDLRVDMIITGAGAQSTIIDADGIDGVFHVLDGVTASLIGMTLTGGYRFGDGGGLRVQGIDTVVTALDLLVEGNSSIYGGGVAVQAGTLTFSQGAIVNNFTAEFFDPAADAGGLLVATQIVGQDGFGADVTLVNTTVSGNTGVRGGGIVVDPASTLTTRFTTVAFNTASDRGGGLWVAPAETDPVLPAGAATITTSILANNAAPTGPDCRGTVTSTVKNLISNAANCTGFAAPQDFVNQIARLDPLAVNAPGSTPSHMLQNLSAAFNADLSAGCFEISLVDQRGTKRPKGGSCDLGSIERLTALPAAATPVAPSNVLFMTSSGVTQFEWTPATDAVSYQIIINNVSTGVSILTDTESVNGGLSCSLSACIFPYGQPLADGYYRWTVTAINEAGSTPTTATLDFEVDSVAGLPNRLSNASFELGGSTPSDWTVRNKIGDKRICLPDITVDQVRDGSCAFVFKGSNREAAKLIQKADLSGHTFAVGDVVRLSAFVNTGAASSAKFKVIIAYTNPNRKPTKLVLPPLPNTNKVYQPYRGELTITVTKIKSIKVVINHLSKSGKMYIDALSLKLIPAVP